MLGALQTMLKHEGARSLVWLHHGMYVNESICQDHTREAIQQSAREIGIKHLDVKITTCSDALAELATCSLPTSNQALVDQVEEATGRLENCTDKEDKRSTIDLDKPFGKLKGPSSKLKDNTPSYWALADALTFGLRHGTPHPLTLSLPCYSL